MTKKLLGIILALVMVFSMTQALAQAATVPSKTTQDMASVASLVSAETGIALPASFQVALQAPSIAAEQVLADLFAFTQTAPPASYFPEEVRIELAKLLPEWVDVNTLALNEFVTLGVIDYDEAYGDVIISFEFATEYADGQPIVALVGVKQDDSEDIVWTALQAEVVDGLVKIHFTKEVLLLLKTGEAMLAILNGAAG